ncbi:hypothetical protein DJ522_08225, partial [Sulfolobus sp. F3]
MRDATKSVKEDIDDSAKAITTPIYQTTAYLYPEGEKYRYSREANPTVLELAKKIAELEGAEQGVAFSSGMGAISTVSLSLLKPNANVLIHRDMFARTYKFFMDFVRSWGVNVDSSLPGNQNLIEMAKSKKYNLIFIESISNPLLRVIDIPELSKIVREYNGILVVDSTFATPINQKPLELGSTIVIHSASKFLAGHNDVIAGLAAGYSEYLSVIDQMRRTLGTSLDPHAAYLTLRGIKTLKIRMDVINRNAEQIAEFLEGHSKVKRVYYPGLKTY